jgi:hypothetical protein
MYLHSGLMLGGGWTDPISQLPRRPYYLLINYHLSCISFANNNVTILGQLSDAFHPFAITEQWNLMTENDHVCN